MKPDWFDRRYWTKGSYTNDTSNPVLVCIDGHPTWFDSDRSSGPDEDVDGYRDSTGQWHKVWGRTGYTTKVSDEWVRKHWPDCH